MRVDTRTSLVASLANPVCPWNADDDLPCMEETPCSGFISAEQAEEGLGELARRVEDAEHLATFSGGRHHRSYKERNEGRRKETRVSELVSIVEVVDDDERDDDDDERGEDIRIVQRDLTNGDTPSIYDVLLLVALYAEYMPASAGLRELSNALQMSTQGTIEEHIETVLPMALMRLHDDIVAHVEFEEAQVCSTTLDSYVGPSPWERCIRCMQLTWFVKNMRGGSVDERDMMVMLHALALGSKDVSYQVRNQSLECVDALIGTMRDQGVHRKIKVSCARAAMGIVKESIAANDDRCWSAGYRCAGHLIGLLATLTVDDMENDMKESRRLMDGLFEHVMRLAERNRHSLVYASVWLETLGVQLRALGVELMHYAPVLLPMLVEWAKALHVDVQLGALRCLLVYVQQCWPRNRATGAMIWKDLDEVYDSGTCVSNQPVARANQTVTRADHDNHIAVLVEIGKVLARTGGMPVLTEEDKPSSLARLVLNVT